MKSISAAVLILLIAVPALAQAPFSFKGNTLGMSLADFRNANRGSIWINTGDPNRRVNKKLSREVETPLCTDQFDDFPGAEPRRDDEVVCNASPGADNAEGLTIAGYSATSILYRFYKGKLYRIDIDFPSGMFALVRLAFNQKYGPPAKLDQEAFQNGFGASWTGDILRWQRGEQGVTMREGPGNGPGQDQASDSTATFFDGSCAPPAQSRSLVDF